MRGRILVFALSASLVLGACTTLGRMGIGPQPPAWKLPPPPAPEAAVVQPGALHRSTLDNGLRIMVLEDRRLPRAVLGLVFTRGEAMLPPDQAGLVSFTAELLERGAGDRDALAFAEWVDEIGASFGASAGWDTVDVGTYGLSRDLDRLFAILEDAVRAPRFEPEEADRARKERLAALERAIDDPDTLANWHTARVLYADHRFALPVSGTPETVAGFDAEKARELHARLFVPNGAIFYASGDVDAADIARRAAAAFGSWERKPLPDAGPPPPAEAPPPGDAPDPGRRIVIVDRPDLAQTQITVAHEGISRTAEDRIPASLMNSVMGGSGFSSRLMEKLRAEQGLTYGVYSGFALRRDPGPFIVSTSTRVGAVRRALDSLLAVLEGGRSHPPDADELLWAKPLAIGRFSMGLETSAAVMDSLVNLEAYGLPSDSLDTYRSRVKAVTPEQVREAALAHLHPDRAAIVLVGPAETLRSEVQTLGTVRVVQP